MTIPEEVCEYLKSMRIPFDTDRFPGALQTGCYVRPECVSLTNVEELECYFFEAHRALRVALRRLKISTFVEECLRLRRHDVITLCCCLTRKSVRREDKQW